MALAIYANTSTQDTELGSSGAEFTEISPTNDTLIFSAGSDVVKDGEPIPTQAQLISAGVVITGAELIVPKYFLQDISESELKEIFNMGNQDKRYVLAFDFDGATASEPVLEVWDDTDMDSIDEVTLGEGSASLSWWRGITTTDGLPGSNWTGSRLAGSGSGYFLFLNNENGALAGADTLYCQLKIIIPSTASAGGSANPIIAVKWTSN